MTALAEALHRASISDPDVFRPVIYRPSDRQDLEQLEDLLRKDPCLQVQDRLSHQLSELIKVLNPSRKYTPDELGAAAQAHLTGCPPAEYGVWVHYPWSHRLVHLLDEAEFALVRTDRNRNKITREEQVVLSIKRVGVIGLSVGQSVSIALAMERSFGELRLADFDTLDLSNLNRIRSGVHQLGSNKAVNAAREIAEIDPFLKVTCFTNGITQENLESFLTEGGKLDVLVEECDDVVVKIRTRLRAKKLGIPVVMDTSDRGLIDVERYDLEPERPIMHGFLKRLDLSILDAPLTAEQKVTLIMAMVDQTALSQRMKASLPEIGRSLLTWPQLGSHVMLGGALTAEVVRRILLGSMDWSGRWYIDLEELQTRSRSVVPEKIGATEVSSVPTH